MTLGVEEEFLIVDAATGELVARAGELFAGAQTRLGDDVAKELNLCQIEIGTPICHDLAGVRGELTRLRAELTSAAASLGARIAATATHPFGSWRDQRIDPGSDRYRRIADVYQVVARQQVIAGCHVHVGIEDRDLAVEVMNRARPWLPVLVALSANSPFWQGVDTGYASYRLQVWQRWPTSGMPPQLSSAAEFDALVDELVTMEAIEDATFIYWYARPSARYPTIEFRACDVCLDVDATVAVAGVARALAWTCRRNALEDRPDLDVGREVLDAAMWRAARYGLDGTLVSPALRSPIPATQVVQELLEYIEDGLEAHGDRDEVAALVGQIIDVGNGASRQRRAHSRSGSLRDTIRAIVDATVPSNPATGQRSDVVARMDTGGSVHSFVLRVELADEPNSLARVAGALGRLQANIVDIDIQEVDGSVVDQIVVEAPMTATVDTIRRAVVAAGARRVDARPMPDDFDRDIGVRALDAASTLIQTDDAQRVTDVVSDVIPADRATFEPITTLVVADTDKTRLALGMAVVTSHVAPTGDSFTAIVPRMGRGRVVFDALVVTRTTAPFSVTEVARLRALLRFNAARTMAADGMPSLTGPSS
ncbi:MAG: glutamate---cysteine ligase / carboxylate-amine ligase [Acidimicrobiaceae bacterium]